MYEMEIIALESASIADILKLCEIEPGDLDPQK